MARSTVQAKSKNYWGPIELARLVLFFVWWPGEFGRELYLHDGNTDDSTCVLDGTYVQTEEQGDAKGSNLGLKENQLGAGVQEWNSYQGRGEDDMSRERIAK